MPTLIVCVSKEHGNTRKLADAIALELDARVVEPDEVDLALLSRHDLICFGSGIRYGRHYQELLELVERLPDHAGKRAFIFSTSGFGWTLFHSALRKRLAGKGFEILGEVCCKGLDTIGLLRLFGGVNKGRPNARDLAEARRVVSRLSR